MNEYDEDDWLDGYICFNYSSLMTDSEWAGLEALRIQSKVDYATQRGDEEDANTYAAYLRRHTDLNRFAVTKALKMGGSTYTRKIRKRILLEHSDQIDLNRCPKCNRIPRTPKAKLCPWCYHNWHDEDG